MRALNLTLLTDLYELTMMQGYFKNPTDQIVVFDAFYRKNPCDGGYAICAGLEQVIEYIRDLHFAPDDIDYLKSLKIFDTDFMEYLRGFYLQPKLPALSMLQKVTELWNLVCVVHKDRMPESTVQEPQ